MWKEFDESELLLKKQKEKKQSIRIKQKMTYTYIPNNNVYIENYSY